MTIIGCVVYVLILLIVIAWLLYELHLDRVSQQTHKPTVPGPRERLLVKSDC